ncbi:MAG: hypothetical protein AAF682_03500 [Planctomycetota bacterium]
MKKLICSGTLLAALSASAFFAVEAASGDPLATTPVNESPVRLLHAQPFFLDEPWMYEWRADHPMVSSGYIVAISAESEILPVRQTHMPLLFIGDMPVARLNDGSESGVYIGFVPAEGTPETGLSLDLTEAPIFWGKPDILPERLTPADAQAELAKAVAAGAVAQREQHVAAAMESSGGAVFTETYGTLRTYAADLVERFSPGEADLISGLRLVPLIK